MLDVYPQSISQSIPTKVIPHTGGLPLVGSLPGLLKDPFGFLTRAREAGITISQDMVSRAVEYLQQAPPRPQQAQGDQTQGSGETWPPKPWSWDRLVFREYVLSLNGGASADLGVGGARAGGLHQVDQRGAAHADQARQKTVAPVREVFECDAGAQTHRVILSEPMLA